MKKNLMLISFAFIFLLSVSIISAGLWITGDITSKAAGAPAGWTITKASDGITDCFLPPEKSQRRGLNRLWANRNGGPQPIKVGDPCISGGQSGTYAQGTQSIYCKTGGRVKAG